MENDRDILGKADALLRRHAPARPEHGEGADVPVLTELITPGGAASPAPATPATPATADAAVAAPRGAAPALRDDDYTRALIAEVVNAVQSRLAHDLEHRLAQQVMAEVHASVAATLGDLRQDIANAAGDAVAEALARRPHR
jgi:cell pole-organizing protein PopZ